MSVKSMRTLRRRTNRQVPGKPQRVYRDVHHHGVVDLLGESVDGFTCAVKEPLSASWNTLRADW